LEGIVMPNHSGIIRAIEDAAYENGTLGLDVIEYAAECGYGHYTLDGEWYLDRDDLQQIADIFCDGFDAINY
jgi:hypothetical protein